MSDRMLRSHFLYVCMSVCMSHNQIIRLNEKVNLIENLPRIEPRTCGIESKMLSIELMEFQLMYMKIWLSKQK